MNEATLERQNHDKRQKTITAEQWAAERTRTENFPLSSGETAKLYIHEPNYVPSKGIIIDFHGSGFVHLHNDHDSYFCKRIGIATQYTVLDFDYPLAPEHPFPAALDACDELVQAVQAHYSDYCAAIPQKLILIGHSAGGNLVAGTQMRALKAGRPVADLAVLDYPALDLDTDPDDLTYPTGAVISAEQAKRFNRFYRANTPLGNPEVSPVLASVPSLVGFPQTVIHTADHDTLAPEGETFGHHLALAHTPVTTKRYANSLHGFTVSLTGAYQESFNDMVQQIQRLV
ncbi:alpha/beta hydrolase fold domain-containing protein [Lactiplantibacillus nangangensis]|uniref:Alpha/beta hydrolase fold domain-containing protein n=1 Tax=Lactiplantibacillus nangangensis TaxID=2559917 RepID=A0ABW1SNT1_9LACO|nr:alpha/beta hydrolase fold domain-containing protein [Lactiplantibacillus nangangensis]